MKILVGCEMSGIVREAFRRKGHEAISCDLIPTLKRGPHHQGDLLEFAKSQHWDMLIAFPPCTHLCVSGARHFYRKKEVQKEAIHFIEQLWNLPIEKIALENPVGILSTRFKKPNQIINPFHFGHLFPKKTCLWLKNLPNLERTKDVELQMRTTKTKLQIQAHHNLPGIEMRYKAMFRSFTFQGIADAMADQWGTNP